MAAKKGKEDSLSKAISVRFKPVVSKALENEAITMSASNPLSNISVSDIIRIAVMEYLERKARGVYGEV